jgi:hypothetical protein
MEVAAPPKNKTAARNDIKPHDVWWKSLCSLFPYYELSLSGL